MDLWLARRESVKVKLIPQGLESSIPTRAVRSSDQAAKETDDRPQAGEINPSHILADDGIASVMVGMTTVHEVENNVRPSYEREKSISWQDIQWLNRKTDLARGPTRLVTREARSSLSMEDHSLV